MLNKKNLKQSLDISFVKKKIAESYYQKYYVRGGCFVDNSFNFYHCRTALNSGFSFFKNISIFRHKYSTNFFFTFFVKRKLTKKYIFINFFALRNRNYFAFVLLKPVRGGFFSYFSGIRAFIPMKHIFSFLKNYLVVLVLKKNNLLLFYSTKNIIKILLTLRFSSLNYINTKFLFFINKKQFSKPKKNRRFRYRYIFKSIFLLKQ